MRLYVKICALYIFYNIVYYIYINIFTCIYTDVYIRAYMQIYMEEGRGEGGGSAAQKYEECSAKSARVATRLSAREGLMLLVTCRECLRASVNSS